ncbi:MAG: cytochrome c2, partial [Lysobacterales bacterium]
QYGCYSCHNISGFENAKPIGVALNEEGSKSLHKFDFGYVHVDHTKHSWFDQKLKAPRSFDNSKVKAADEKLIMPNFKLTEHEREAVVTSILGFVSNVTVRGKMKPRTTENLRREKGEAIIAQLNCRSCHAIEGNGGTVQTTVTDWLTNFEGHSVKDAEKITESFSPPNLHGAGKKIDAKWLFNFLHSPEEQVRPWLKVRMPSYEFNVDHLNMLVQFFNTVDGEDQFPFHKEADVSLTSKEYKAAEKLFSQDYLGCTLCHVVGDQQPTGTKDTWAPDLGLANKRLKPEWIVEWIKDPSRLVPGTTMPTFFDPSDYENSGPEDIMDGDEDEQIRILRNYLMTLGNTTQNKKSDESMDEVESSTTSVPENITVEPEL